MKKVFMRMVARWIGAELYRSTRTTGDFKKGQYYYCVRQRHGNAFFWNTLTTDILVTNFNPETHPFLVRIC